MKINKDRNSGKKVYVVVRKYKLPKRYDFELLLCTCDGWLLICSTGYSHNRIVLQNIFSLALVAGALQLCVAVISDRKKRVTFPSVVSNQEEDEEEDDERNKAKDKWDGE